MVADGTLTNAGDLNASGAGNALQNVTATNTGTIDVLGTLTIDNTTAVNNADGEIRISGTGTLNLTNATIAGGLLTGTGIIATLGIGSKTTLDGSSGHAVTIDAGTSVTVNTGTTLQLTGMIGGDGEISVAGASKIIANGAISVPVNAGQLANDTLLTLEGSAALTVVNLVGDLNAAALTGTLDVTTTDVTGAGTISIATGIAATTITSGALVSGDPADTIVVDASALVDDALLTLVGPANFTVTGLKGDLDVSRATGIVTIADAPTIIITTSGDGISSIDASAFADNHTLILIGSDNSTVTALKGDIDASGLTGTLDVTTADAATISITSNGGGTTAIDASALADALTDGNALTLIGYDPTTVTGLQANLDADRAVRQPQRHHRRGRRPVDRHRLGRQHHRRPGADRQPDPDPDRQRRRQRHARPPATSTPRRQRRAHRHRRQRRHRLAATPSPPAATTFRSPTPAPPTLDTILVAAARSTTTTLLTLTGAANYTVTALKGDIDAAQHRHARVTTADAATISITSNGGGTTAVDATALADNHILTLIGSDPTTVTGLQANLVADHAVAAASTSPPSRSPACRSPPARAATPSTPRR